MKKIKLLVLPLFMFVLLSGCEKATIKDTQKKMSSLDNYSMNMRMDIKIKVSDQEVSMPIKINSKIDKKNKISYSKVTSFQGNNQISREVYSDTSKSGILTLYSKDNDSWIKKEKDSKSQANLMNIQELIAQSTKSKKIESSDKNTIHYEVTIDKETFKESLLSVENTSNIFDIVDDVTMEVYVEKDTNYMSKIYADVNKSVKAKIENANLTQFTMEVYFSNYNSAGYIKLPDEVKNAKNAKSE